MSPSTSAPLVAASPHATRLVEILESLALQKISILVDPILDGKYLLTEGAHRIARTALKLVKPNYRKWETSKYRGHFAVTRSLVEGLTTAGLPFNYAPNFAWELADTVVVLSGPRPLRQAIELKRRGRIKRLFAGPTIVSLASDYDGLVKAPEIDGIIVAGDWVVDLFAQDFPEVRQKALVWPAGVDTSHWSPIDKAPGRRVLVYHKPSKGPLPPIQPYIDWLRSTGYEVTVIDYGHYTPAAYRDLLQQTDLMVGFSRHETQGLAWAEAWSSDVPTLLWWTDDGRQNGRHHRSSPAPYLTADNGAFFVDLDGFKDQIEAWEANRSRFQPRQWTIANMSDEVCAKMLINRIHGWPART